MPQFSCNPPPGKRSEFRPSAPSKGRTSGIFTLDFPAETASGGDSAPDSAGRPAETSFGHSPAFKRPGPALSPEATDPFPPGLFRMPLPNRLFAAMPGLSDSALRALLALFRLSFRFEPETSTWVCPENTFTRAEIEKECGLSDEGTRQGLRELEDAGWVSTDRSGRSHEHTLGVGVPKRRYTYVPTDFFETAFSLSGTELRLALAVLRATWGWTTDSTAPKGSNEPTGEGSPEHRRWARLTTAALSKVSGRSESAVKTAAKELNGTLLRRRRPTNGAYYYRFSAEALIEQNALIEKSAPENSPSNSSANGGRLQVERRAEAFFSMGPPNELPPDRQQSGPSYKGYIESFSREAKQCARAQDSGPPSSEDRPQNGTSAVQGPENPSPRSGSQRRKPPSKRGPHRDPGTGGSDRSKTPQSKPSQSEPLDLTGFSAEKRALGQKLANVGVWPRRIPELLARYSVARIEANFELYRKRASSVEKGGAWLAAAIEGGYALPSPSGESSSEDSLSEGKPSGEPDSPGNSAFEPGEPSETLRCPKPGTKVSETRKQELLEAGLATEADFDRFKCFGDPHKKQHIYRAEKTPSPAAR